MGLAKNLTTIAKTDDNTQLTTIAKTNNNTQLTIIAKTDNKYSIDDNTQLITEEVTYPPSYIPFHAPVTPLWVGIEITNFNNRPRQLRFHQGRLSIFKT